MARSSTKKLGFVEGSTEDRLRIDQKFEHLAFPPVEAYTSKGLITQAFLSRVVKLQNWVKSREKQAKEHKKLVTQALKGKNFVKASNELEQKTEILLSHVENNTGFEAGEFDSIRAIDCQRQSTDYKRIAIELYIKINGGTEANAEDAIKDAAGKKHWKEIEIS